MASVKSALYVFSVLLLVLTLHVAAGSNTDDSRTTTDGVAVNTNADDTASIPDFDGDGTIGFGDFVIFAGAFGSHRGDQGYDARFDLNGDGEIEFADFVIFAQNFGKAAPSPVVSIPDAILRSAIEDALDRAVGAAITVADMATLDSIQSVNWGRAGIRDLTGLEYATSLAWLALQKNDITNLSPLAGLTNLNHLDLWSNRIRDISPLAGLTNLTWLSVGGNHLTDVSPLAGLTKLTYLHGSSNSIVDISPLAGLTNLTGLYLSGNSVTDISPLAGLDNLSRLWLMDNFITDISPLAGLENLWDLNLGYNPIVDISAVSGLVNMLWLELEATDVTDISALSGLTGMRKLVLGFNFITDISALPGLTNLSELDLRGNPLGRSSIDVHIPAHERNGATVTFNSLREGDFDIELVFLESFTERHKRVFRYAARRWMAAVMEDLPDYVFTQGWSGQCGGQSYEISAGERIDDLRIYVISFDLETAKDARYPSAAWGGPHLLRDTNHLPVVGCMGFGFYSVGAVLANVVPHEIGHVLGFTSGVWDRFGYFQNPPDGDQHFTGPLAITAFDDAGGREYAGAKVPVESGYHWRSTILDAELMGGMQLWRPSGAALSAITVQSFADLGYGVDVTQADPYTLPSAASGAKIAVSTLAVPGFGINGYRPETFTQSGADRSGQESIRRSLPLGPADGRAGHLESGERLRGPGITFDLARNQQVWDTALPTHTAPELTCGAEPMNEPIYVVDPQGRIVRTINR